MLASFAFTGSTQSFTVPAGVTRILVELVGAGGGDSRSGSGDGGRGSRLVTELDVTPGETIAVYVGGRGVKGVSMSTVGGGWNGGGLGEFSAGSGGGATDLRRGGSTLADRIAAAAGAGGAANEWSGRYGGDGGDGDGGGQNGQGGWGTGGWAGTATVGGGPGTGVNKGSLGLGGQGGASGSDRGGGGGGGGWYGGGGGTTFIGEPAGGGGGGSSVTTGDVMSLGSAASIADGSVTIWDATPAPPPGGWSVGMIQW